MALNVSLSFESGDCIRVSQDMRASVSLVFGIRGTGVVLGVWLFFLCVWILLGS